ncbi:MAG: FtsQ-type POTRA domain-containing protein [Myxococcales bacterium]|nr:FtsQ-type POTRA domain-containing protein [Myxococcales bacterium]
MSPPPSVGNRRVRKPAEPAKDAPKGPDSVAPFEAAPSVPRPSDGRWVRAARAVVGLTLILSLGGGAAWGGRKWLKQSPRFAVKEVVVLGAKRRSAEDLSAMAGVQKGANIFSIDLDRARGRVVRDPWIREARLARQLPQTIVIDVVEREAAGIVTMGEAYLVTREGEVIKRLEAGDPADLPVVTGIAVGDLVADREGTTRLIQRALDLAADYEHGPLAKLRPLQEVHAAPNGDMSLVVGKSIVTLRLGAPPYRRKLEQAVRVLAEVDRRGGKPEVVMLDDEARPDRAVVRMK